jgi:hypothetical protein
MLLPETDQLRAEEFARLHDLDHAASAWFATLRLKAAAGHCRSPNMTMTIGRA